MTSPEKWKQIQSFLVQVLGGLTKRTTCKSFGLFGYSQEGACRSRNLRSQGRLGGLGNLDLGFRF